jgi:hypothetical protein
MNRLDWQIRRDVCVPIGGFVPPVVFPRGAIGTVSVVRAGSYTAAPFTTLRLLIYPFKYPAALPKYLLINAPEKSAVLLNTALVPTLLPFTNIETVDTLLTQATWFHWLFGKTVVAVVMIAEPTKRHRPLFDPLDS